MPEDIIALIKALASNSTENECLEFKHGNVQPDRIGRDIVALSNSAALFGHAHACKVWGIDDASHEIIGTTFNPKTMMIGNQELELWLRQHLSDNVEFRFEQVQTSGRDVVLLRIWPAQYRPALWNGIAYIRTGSSTQELKRGSRREEELWRRTRSEVFEMQVAVSGLNSEEILSALNVDLYRRAFDMPQTSSSGLILHNFEQEQLIVAYEGGTYGVTNLGALLFANNLDDFPSVSRKALRVIKYDGLSPISSSRSRTFPYGYANLDMILEFVETMLPQQDVIEGATRKTQHAYPHIALRELCANMLIHQDLSITGAGPMISIFDNRIEFTNPGKSLVELPKILNDPPHSRNEHLAALSRRLGLCEEAGSGWDKVVLACESDQLPAPEAEEPGDNVRVTLLQSMPFKKLTLEQRIDSTYWHSCMKYAQRLPMTNSSLRERFGLPDSGASQISRLIKDCLERGVIKVSDPDAGKRYITYVPSWV